MEQYNHDTTGMMPTTKVESKPRSDAEHKVEQLEEKINQQQQEIQKLHRDVSRLKNDIDSVITMVRNRG